MRSRLPAPVQFRAIIGVIALYALVLQMVLGGLAPRPALAALDALCGHAVEAADGAGSPGEQPPAHHGAHERHACCLPAQAVPLPAPVASAVALDPPREARPLPWPPSERQRARAPPDRATAPRGPPAA